MGPWRGASWRAWLSSGLALVALGGGVWAATAPLPQGPRELVYVIPKGIAARQAAGQPVAALPSQIRLTLGIRDVLVIRNDDDAPQYLGPVRLAPGQTFRVPFQAAARFDFACSVHDEGKVVILVERWPRAGWERLRWRLENVINP